MQKIKMITGSLMVFLIILATNLIDQQGFQKISSTTSEVYYNRIIASELIYKMRESICEKEKNYLQMDSMTFQENNQLINEKLNESLLLFHETELTNKESELLIAFEANIDALYSLETEMDLSKQDLLQQKINLLTSQLGMLLQIQSAESKKQVLEAKTAVDTIKFFTRIEIIALIIISIIIIGIVLYEPKNK